MSSAPPPPTGTPASPLLAAFDQQVRWCTQAGAPFSARALAAAARWLATDPSTHDEIAAAAEDPLAGAVALRFLSGLHLLALQGKRPWSALWPPETNLPDGAEGDETLRVAASHAWHFHTELMRRALASPPQTNEVQRSAALLPGLLHVARATGLPLSLLEIGASAGLNLWPDHYRLESPAWQWGADEAALVLRPEWRGAVPLALAAVPLAIEYRAACDLAPVDLAVDSEGLRLASYVWADQPERLSRLRAAVAVAREQMAAQGVKVQAAKAAAFLRQQLTLRLPGQAMVLMHSVMWQYLPATEQAAIEALMKAAGAASTPDTPLAWLRFEPPKPDLHMELRCRLWNGGTPEGQEHLLARCHPHGAFVDWLDDRDTAAA
jgi:hypothetical protein